MTDRTCSTEGCDSPLRARGMCKNHYQNWRRANLEATKLRPVDERFWSKVVEQPSGCWEWFGTRNNTNYGMFSVGQTRWFAHRYAYTTMVADIPEGLVLDHLCRNPPCINPYHLDPVTQQVNLLRGETLQAANVAKTHCSKGHPFDEVNTVIHQNRRRCLTCRRERGLARYYAKKSDPGVDNVKTVE